MIEGVSLPWAQIGAGTLVTLFVLMLWTDRILTKSRHLEVVQILKERIADRDAQISERDRRIERTERQRDDAITLTRTLLETNAEMARQKDASLEALERLAQHAESGGGDL